MQPLEIIPDRQWRLFAKHPLDLIPFFRRWTPSKFRSYVYTVLVCLFVTVLIAMVNAVFGRVPNAFQIRQYAVIALCIGVCQSIVFDVFCFFAERLRIRRSTALGMLFALAAPVFGLYSGFAIAALFLGGGQWFHWLFSRESLMSNSMLVFVIAFFIWYSTSNSEKLHASVLAQSGAVAREAAAKRDTANAELKMLRAQVEPHFLYNTLANVVSLIDRDPRQAKQMTERLIGYMRHTLDASRRDHATVGDELSIIRDYLEILRLRMGERLSYSMVADDAVRAMPLTPMLLQPLVENAIKHGLEPKIDGGHVAVIASADHAELRIEIEDTGLGFGASPDTAGAGSGIANVRARLAATYGDSARLLIDEFTATAQDSSIKSKNYDHVGTRISVRIPRVTIGKTSSTLL